MSHKNNVGADLSEQSVLAANFIPQHLRQVNEWPVTAPLYAAAVANQQTTAAAAGIGPKGLLVPFVPICYCFGQKVLSTIQQPLHAKPLRVVPSDLYYAVDYHRRAGAGADGNLQQPSRLRPGNEIEPNHEWPTKEKPPPPPPPPRPPQPPLSVDNISNLDDYRTTWEDILELERKEVLLRYENYSQYAKPLYIQTIASKNKPTNNNGQTTVAVSEAGIVFKANIDVQGIADASPPLMIGDTVLARPMHRVSLPLPHQTHQAPSLNDLKWSPPIHVAEVHATVLSVQRGSMNGSSTGDKVLASWLNRHESEILMHTLRTAANQGKIKINRLHPLFLFNVRFVPATTRHERCLTALDWLAESFREHPRAAMDLLFPVVAHAFTLPAGELASNDILAHSKQLNDKQSSFVNMVLGRTKHPSTDQIRGPMVLTGPAGTGTLLHY